MNNQVISYSHEYHLLWGNLKSLTPHVYFLININTRNDKEDTRTSSPTSEKPPKPKNDSSLILLQIYFRYFLFPHNVLPAQLSPQRKGRVAVKQLSKLRRKWSKPLSKHLDLLHKLLHFESFIKQIYYILLTKLILAVIVVFIVVDIFVMISHPSFFFLQSLCERCK